MRLKSPSGRRVATTGRPRPRFHIRCSYLAALEISAFQGKEVLRWSTVQCRKPVGKVGDGTPVKVLEPQVLVEPKVVAPSMGKR